MASVSLFDPVGIGSVMTRNRICIPPMVLYGISDESGMAKPENAAHYRALARGGAGLIIQEATCVSSEGRLSMDQLGIWSEDHIPGLRRITDAVHQEGCPIFLQIHHAGLVSVGQDTLCPSDYVLSTPKGGKHGREMRRDEICRIRDAFVAAAVRAEKAGYDGVELHGCHGYLLCQFLNSRVNRRQDEYGQPERLTLEIVQEIRKSVRSAFTVGIRLGAFEPTLDDGIAHAKTLEQAGVQFIDVSYGFTAESEPIAPGDPALLDVIRAAGAIQKTVSVPVFAVNSIRTPRQAQEILMKTGVSMVDIGRSALVDPEWANRARRGETPGACLGCRVCQWRIDRKKCPGRLRLRKQKDAHAF